MAYEYEDFIDAMRFGLTMSDRDTTDYIWKMVDEVVNKAKAFDAIVDIQDDFFKYHGFYPCVEEYAEEVGKIISEYLEDE